MKFKEKMILCSIIYTLENFDTEIIETNSVDSGYIIVPRIGDYIFIDVIGKENIKWIVEHVVLEPENMIPCIYVKAIKN